MTGTRLVVWVCVAHVLSLAGIGTFPSLLPTFFEVWGLSNTEAGWISGIYFGGYAAAVPVLAGLTDRVDSRRVYLACALLTGASMIAFAVFADGFWTALACRALAGIGVAGTYMPGLKLLTDRVPEAHQSRLVAFYTSSFAIGSSLSIWMAGEIEALASWPMAFAFAAAGSVCAWAIVASCVRPMAVAAREGAGAVLLDFRPVLRNRGAMAYVLAYGAHCWELLGFRSWIVAFLAFSLTLQEEGAWAWRATAAAAAINLLGVPASILGNELAVRFGRRRAASCVMICAALSASLIGLAAGLPYWAVVVLVSVYGVFVTADSAALTAGSIAFAAAGQKGATMAMHSFVGFLTSFLGPLTFGVVLDAAGGNENIRAWWLAFAVMGAGVILGPLFLARFGRKED